MWLGTVRNFTCDWTDGQFDCDPVASDISGPRILRSRQCINFISTNTANAVRIWDNW